MFQVCNHSELFERREIKSPFFMKTESYHLPKLIYQEGNFAYLVSNSKNHPFIISVHYNENIYIYSSLETYFIVAFF